MPDDDILREIRAVRDEFARSHGYDLAAMFATLQAMDIGDRKVVRLPPRRPASYGGSPTAEPSSAPVRPPASGLEDSSRPTTPR